MKNAFIFLVHELLLMLLYLEWPNLRQETVVIENHVVRNAIGRELSRVLYCARAADTRSSQAYLTPYEAREIMNRIEHSASKYAPVWLGYLRSYRQVRDLEAMIHRKLGAIAS
jgi:hypothetical protein